MFHCLNYKNISNNLKYVNYQPFAPINITKQKIAIWKRILIINAL